MTGRGHDGRARAWAGVALATLAVVLGPAACSSPDPEAPACTPVAVDTSCTPGFDPTFDAIFARTFKPTCSRSGVSCHSSKGHQGGIAFEEIEEAYRTLVNDSGAVRPGDASCSILMARLTSTDPYLHMPPGKNLDPTEQCAIVKWIAGGAKR